MVAALMLMLLLRYGGQEFVERVDQHIRPFALIFLLWIVAFYVLESYNVTAPFNHRKFVAALVSNVALAITVLYIFSDTVGITPRRNLALVVLAFIPLFYSWRFLAMRTVDRLTSLRSVAIIGSDRHALELIGHIAAQRRQGYRVVAVVQDPEHPVPPDALEASVRVFSTVEELQDQVTDLQVAAVIVSDSWYSLVNEQLYRLLPLRIRFYQLTTFWEEFLESIPIYSARESWFLENLNRGGSKGYLIAKRGLDIASVLFFSPIFLIFGLLTALAVRLTSAGPVIFSQVRVGRNEQNFTVYKFRSMYIDAEKHGAQWATEKDPRITPVGRFIRATRLDEIPQVFNVLRGDMSIIGPRPERPEFVEDLAREIPHYRLRHLVRPGLTGWAQVRYRYGASVDDAAVKLTYDLFYVKNISLVLDTKITLKTILTVLSRQGR